ncbi:hypothetical protein PYCC9005_005838 [Savitreella phatthalungensis]
MSSAQEDSKPAVGSSSQGGGSASRWSSSAPPQRSSQPKQKHKKWKKSKQRRPFDLLPGEWNVDWASRVFRSWSRSQSRSFLYEIELSSESPIDRRWGMVVELMKYPIFWFTVPENDRCTSCVRAGGKCLALSVRVGRRAEGCVECTQRHGNTVCSLADDDGRKIKAFRAIVAQCRAYGNHWIQEGFGQLTPQDRLTQLRTESDTPQELDAKNQRLAIRRAPTQHLLRELEHRHNVAKARHGAGSVICQIRRPWATRSSEGYSADGDHESPLGVSSLDLHLDSGESEAMQSYLRLREAGAVWEDDRLVNNGEDQDLPGLDVERASQEVIETTEQDALDDANEDKRLEMVRKRESDPNFYQHEHKRRRQNTDSDIQAQVQATFLALETSRPAIPTTTERSETPAMAETPQTPADLMNDQHCYDYDDNHDHDHDDNFDSINDDDGLPEMDALD